MWYSEPHNHCPPKKQPNATLDLRVALRYKAQDEELCLLLLGPAQQSWMFLDVCAGPRSSGQSSSMRTVQLFWMPLRELPEKHLGKLCVSRRGAMVTAPRPGAAVLDVSRRLSWADEQWSELLDEKCAACPGWSCARARCPGTLKVHLMDYCKRMVNL